MQRAQESQLETMSPVGEFFGYILRIGIAVLVPVVAFFILIQGFLFLRANEADKWVITTVAVVWGVGGVAALYWIFNWLLEQLPVAWTARLQPFLFVGPAMAILTWFLAFPTARTFYISLYDRNGPDLGAFVGLRNYLAVFTERDMLEAFRNNIMFWMLIATPLTVIFGLLVAVLADRSKFERLAKSMIFMPMPNWPRKSEGRSQNSALLEVWPMVARKRWISSSVRPMPLSVQTRVAGRPAGAGTTSRVISPLWSGSRRRRALMASTPFCSNSRRKTSGVL